MKLNITCWITRDTFMFCSNIPMKHSWSPMCYRMSVFIENTVVFSPEYYHS